MNVRVKRELQNKARLAYCLVDILEYDVDNLKMIRTNVSQRNYWRH